jgi:hypothetical protein
MTVWTYLRDKTRTRNETIKQIILLIFSSGFSVRSHAREIVKSKGVDNVTVDDLVTDITPKGRAAVPASVKRELLQNIRNFLEAQQII